MPPHEHLDTRAACRHAGVRAVSLRWVDTDKGDAQRPSYRSRLCVREIKAAMRKQDVPDASELFSGMPPLEAVKLLTSLFLSHVHDRGSSSSNCRRKRRRT